VSCAVRVFYALQQLSEEAVMADLKTVKPPAEKKRHMGLLRLSTGESK